MSAARIRSLAERDGWVCNGCGCELRPHSDESRPDVRYATIDHIDPKGGDGAANVWLMCSQCNSSKGDRSLEEWQKTLDFEGGFLKRGFTQVPNALLFDSKVSVGARMTLICLMQFAWKGDPFPGQKRLGEMLAVTDRTVRDYLIELRDAGYIKVFRRGRGQTNVYRIVQLKMLSVTEESSGLDRKQSSAVERKQASGEEYEVEQDEVKTLAAAPRERPRNELWDALETIFGPATTKTAATVRGKVVAGLAMAGATPAEINRRARAWPAHFDSATMTDLAFEKHYDTLGRKPLRRR